MCVLFAIKKVFNSILFCRDKRLSKISVRNRSNSTSFSKDDGERRKKKNAWRIGLVYLLSILATYALYKAVLHFKYQNTDDKMINYAYLMQEPRMESDKNASLTTLNENLVTVNYEQTTEDIVFDGYLPEYCEANTTYLVPVNKNEVKLSEVEDKLKNLRMGGYFLPLDCRPKYKIAIMVPFRNRKEHLAIFLRHMHRFLMNQKIEYRIFVIEQNGTLIKTGQPRHAGTDPFNQGRVYNAGFKEIMWYGAWQCIIFHDVDLLPLDPRIPYACPLYARHMCATIREVKTNKYRTLFGGVSVMSIKVFLQVNGFSNMYWGWGGEDHDMYIRLKVSKIPVVRYGKEIARYTSIPHRIEKPNIYRHFLLKNASSRYLDDGLSNINYTLLNKTIRPLFTHILIDINPEKVNIGDYYKNAKIIRPVKSPLFKY